MKAEKCGLSKIAVCAMAVSALGLFAMSALFIAAAAKEPCADEPDGPSEGEEPDAE